MKTKKITPFIIAFFALMSPGLNAQLLFEETFDYTPGAELVAGAVAGSDNAANTLTGWLTLNNSKSNIQAFSIAAIDLYYPGYPPSGKGKAMAYESIAGQDVFKSFCNNNNGKSYIGPKTLYVSFLINVPFGNATTETTINDFIFAIKASPDAADFNYYGRVFIKSNGTNVQFALGKYSSAMSAWSGNYANGSTHMLVMKYTMGGLNGTDKNSEIAAGYDDKVDLFINPNAASTPPVSPTLHYENAAEGDAYRYSTAGPIIGGLAAVYFRNSDTKPGNTPSCYIDGIRVAESWASIFEDVNAVNNVKETSFKYSVDNVQKLIKIISMEKKFDSYEIMSVNGTVIQKDNLQSNEAVIPTDNMAKGLYLLNMKGKDGIETAKVVL